MGLSVFCSTLCCLDVLDGLEVCCRHNWMSASSRSIYLLQVISLSVGIQNYLNLYNSRKPDANWGSAADAQTFVTAMKSTQELTNNPDHIKNYRPKVLVLTGMPLRFLNCRFHPPC